MSFPIRPFIRHSAALVLAAIFCFILRPAVAETPNVRLIAAPADALVMRREMLADPYAKMDAVSILVPAGWKMSGSTTWIPGDASGPRIELIVSDASTHAGVRLYPDLYFVEGLRESQRRTVQRSDPTGKRWAAIERFYQEGGSVSPGQEIRRQPRSPRDYVMAVLIPKLRPALAGTRDLAVVSEMDLPEIDKAKTAASQVPNVKFTTSRFRISYTAEEGPVSEEFLCTIRARPAGEGLEAVTLWDAEVASSRAVRGALDPALPTLTAIWASRRMQLPYYNFTAQVGQMIVQASPEQSQKIIENETERKRLYAEYQSKAGTQIGDAVRDRFLKEQDVKAKVQERFWHSVNDLAAFTHPREPIKIPLPARYAFSYLSNQGDIVQTDDSSFHPPLEPGTSWDKLEKGK
jgi:hypothetical protein